MFRFHRSLPNISIFHNPSSAQSNQALTLLRSALSSSYPPPSSAQTATTTTRPPLEFNLEVVENPPTADQFGVILSYLSKPASSLLSAHPSSVGEEHQPPSSAKALHALAARNASAIKYPIVVNWDDGQAAVGGDVDGVRGILESLRRKRDGEEKSPKDGDVVQPKGWFS